MKVDKIRDDVWRFKGSGCVYLIKGEENVVVDAGDVWDRDELKEAMSEVVDLGSVGAVLLTHMHHDHLGGLTLFPNAEIFVSGDELKDYLENAERFYFYVDDEIDEVIRLRAKGVGDNVFGMKVLKVPGHTRGGVAFLDERRKLLFSGDTIFGGGIIGRTDLPNSSPGDMMKSSALLQGLVREKGLTLCPGHGYSE